MMTARENRILQEKEHSFFGGNLTSRTVIFSDGTVRTHRNIQPGEYEMGTEQAELIKIRDGEVLILLPEKKGWQQLKAGDTLRIPAESSYTLRARTPAACCCSFH